MKKLSIALMVLASSFANAAEFSDMATVKRVTPRYIEVNNPISSCQTSTEAAAPKEKGIAGAIIGGADDTAEAKMKIMTECGIHVVYSPADIGETMIKALAAK